MQKMCIIIALSKLTEQRTLAMINEKEMQVSINFPIVDLEDGRYLFLYESDVDYIIEEFAPETTEKVLYTPPTIIK